jgi:hypothetical protein
VCRHYIVWGCNYFDYQFATGRIVWDKCNGNSSFSDCEIAGKHAVVVGRSAILGKPMAMMLLNSFQL